MWLPFGCAFHVYCSRDRAGRWRWVLALYILATVPGWPLGRALFGRRHPAGFITGALLGYGLTCLVFWGVLALGSASLATFALAWAVITGITWTLVRASQPRLRGDAATARQALVALPPWGKAEARTFVLLLAIVPAVFVFPYKNLGAQDAQGNRFYRAYFTADFIWHTRDAEDKYDMPRSSYRGTNHSVYLTSSWFSGDRARRPAGQGVERFKVKPGPGVLFLAALIIATWSESRTRGNGHRHCARRSCPSGRRTVHCVGTDRSRPIVSFQVYKSTRNGWRFNGLRVDSIVRNVVKPHHSMAAELGLLACRWTGAGVAGGRWVRSPLSVRAGAIHDL